MNKGEKNVFSEKKTLNKNGMKPKLAALTYRYRILTYSIFYFETKDKALWCLTLAQFSLCARPDFVCIQKWIFLNERFGFCNVDLDINNK